jgi:hypothetical protein
MTKEMVANMDWVIKTLKTLVPEAVHIVVNFDNNFNLGSSKTITIEIIESNGTTLQASASSLKEALEIVEAKQLKT